MQFKYTVKEVAEAYNYSQSTIRQRAVKLGIKPSIVKNNKVYELTQGEVNDIVTYKERIFCIPKIIYVTQTYCIIPSKMNYE